MRGKIVLKRRITPKIVTLPNETTFTAKYEKISLPTNIKVKKNRTIGPRLHQNRVIDPKNQRKNVRFTISTSLLDRLKRIKRYRESRRAQTRSGLASTLATLRLKMGSRAINSVLDKKLINEGIDTRSLI